MYTQEENQDRFNRLDIQEVEKISQRMLDSAGYDIVLKGLDRFVIDGVRRRRCLFQMIELRTYIMQVQEAEA